MFSPPMLTSDDRRARGPPSLRYMANSAVNQPSVQEQAREQVQVQVQEPVQEQDNEDTLLEAQAPPTQVRSYTPEDTTYALTGLAAYQAELIKSIDHLVSSMAVQKREEDKSSSNFSTLQDTTLILERVPTCNGLDPNQIISFIEAVDSIDDLHCFKQERLLINLIPKCQGYLSKWWGNNIHRYRTWQQFKKAMLEELLTELDIESLKVALIYRWQRPLENFREFITDIIQKEKALQLNMPESSLCSVIFNHVNDDTFELMRFPHPPRNIFELQSLGQQVQAANRRKQLFAAAQGNSSIIPANQNPVYYCNHCKKTGHSDAGCSFIKARPSTSKN